MHFRSLHESRHSRRGSSLTFGVHFSMRSDCRGLKRLSDGVSIQVGSSSRDDLEHCFQVRLRVPATRAAFFENPAVESGCRLNERILASGVDASPDMPRFQIAVSELSKRFERLCDPVIYISSLPNKAPEPTRLPVMPRASSRILEVKRRSENRTQARVTPGKRVAHL